MNDTQTSSKRAEANRRNAQRSTGPRTPDGKDRSRFNALKHGLRAATPVLPGEDPDAFDRRLDAWTRDLGPRDDVERFLVRRAVQLSWQLDRADRALAARAAMDRLDADDRLDALADEVADLGRRLFWDPRGPTALYPHWHDARGRATSVSWSGRKDDPDDPARLATALEATPLGCGWMLDRWAELGAVLDEGRPWQAPDRFKAIRLLGRQPLDAWEDRRVESIYLACRAMDARADPDHEFQDIHAELQRWEWDRFIERVNGRDVDSRLLPDAEAGRSALRELVAVEASRLEGLLAEWLAREEAGGGDGGYDHSGEGERLRRYQARCDRTLLRVLETLRRRRKEAGVSKRAPGPAGEEGKEAAEDATSRLADLLQALMEAEAPKATNEANAPAGRDPSTMVGVVPDPPPDAGPATPPGSLASEPCDSGTASMALAADASPADEPAREKAPDRTNEANTITRPVGKAVMSWTAALCIQLACLVWGGHLPSISAVSTGAERPDRAVVEPTGRSTGVTTISANPPCQTSPDRHALLLTSRLPPAMSATESSSRYRNPLVFGAANR